MKQPKEHGLAPKAPSKCQPERGNSDGRESGRKSDSSLSRAPEQQRCHGNTVNFK